MNKLLKTILKTAMYVLDESFDQVDRASDRVSGLVDRSREMISPPQDQLLRNVVTFAAGVGVGIGAGLLFAPSSGKEMRSSIREKVQDISRQAQAR